MCGGERVSESECERQRESGVGGEGGGADLAGVNARGLISTDFHG